MWGRIKCATILFFQVCTSEGHLSRNSGLCFGCLDSYFLMQLSAGSREHTPNHDTKFRAFLFLQSLWLCVAQALNKSMLESQSEFLL